MFPSEHHLTPKSMDVEKTLKFDPSALALISISSHPQMSFWGGGGPVRTSHDFNVHRPRRIMALSY